MIRPRTLPSTRPPTSSTPRLPLPRPLSRGIAAPRSFCSDSGHNHKSGSGFSRRRYLPLTLLPAGLLLLPSLSCDSDPATSPPPSPLAIAPVSELLRSWFVWAMICTPGMVDYSPGLLSLISRTPLKTPVEWFVRHTFFAQFNPGETVAECMSEVRSLRKSNIGTVVNYSAEVDESGLHESGAEKWEREEKDRQRRLEQVVVALDVMGEYEKTLPLEQRGASGFALKMTGLIDANVLERASYTLLRMRYAAPQTPITTPNSATFVPYPGTPESADGQVIARDHMKKLVDPKELFSLQGKVEAMGTKAEDVRLKEGDLEQLATLWQKLRMLGQRAKDNKVILIIDAEHTWYQPAMDAYTLLLSEEFNRPTGNPKDICPVIYGTYQSYLTRQPTHLLAAIAHAEANGYALGLKVVRGAYYLQERKKWADEGRAGNDPIWPTKPATDLSYNGAIATLLSTLSGQLKGKHPERALSVVFGTHNTESADSICENLVKYGLAEKDKESGLLRFDPAAKGHVRVAQLYGMRDDLTNSMATRFVNDGNPVAYKYISYGALAEVMPFLGRRAIENKSLMSGEHGAAGERKKVGRELRRRVFG
ncbi:hypothetical protein L202_04460 [Cryptococcus amylolentus CBS 6039]|uniref:Proline dehydrogenase n=2 Tax=Cryptococcus amylolentus TaxID=104669 RepID=A0A1E3HRL0_9TREE|nr:hypothetical protein L202_04460 [Cryptococcus amylolentus CBS 6039]ODN78942.1 hypothetical protein L202_04460 [Cryptococcus amylolentus CBS 6039]ODO06604.1 hypothetical protein I350_03961 [Cryptococcus amylolentus CBS 6273]